jgi:twitching motility protein PilT
MAQLDQLIKRMLATAGAELMLAAGYEPQLRAPGAQPQTLIARKLTAPHLRLLLGELATGASMAAIDDNDEGEFSYAIPGHPAVTVTVKQWAGNLEVRIRPPGAKRGAAAGPAIPRTDPRADARVDARAPNDLRRAATNPGAEARARTADPRSEDEVPRAPSRPEPLEIELPPRTGGTRHGEAHDLELDLKRPAAPEPPPELRAPRAHEPRPAERGSERAEPEPEPPPRRPVTIAPDPALKGRAPLPEIKPLAAGTEPPIHWLFRKMVQLKASDLHLTAGEYPRIRKDGDIIRIDEQSPRFKANQILELLHPIMPPRNWREFETDNDTDFAYELAGISRFRANVFMDRGGVGAVFRTIPTEILTAEMLGLSQPIQNLCYLSKGLVLVTGPTGSGKSTTLAAMIDLINRQRHDHVITIEDPIEFVHPSKSCLVNQREVGNHTDSFKRALRAALREDPDVILVGELRDLETIAIAIETAETGHLVFGTLHTTTAYSTIDRVIDQFPADRQEQIRAMLSESLKGVVSQTLCKKIGGGRAAALEVLLVNSAVQNLIREGKTFQIPSVMQTARKVGMVLLNDALLELVNAKKVDVKEAYIKAVDKANFVNMCRAANHKLDFLGAEPK